MTTDTLDDAIEDQGDPLIDDVPQPPTVVRCDAAGASCRILLDHVDLPRQVSTRHLWPGPESYPN